MLPWNTLLNSYPFNHIKCLYDININGAFFTAQEAAQNMIPQGEGSIVLVASMSANMSTILLSLRLSFNIHWIRL